MFSSLFYLLPVPDIFLIFKSVPVGISWLLCLPTIMKPFLVGCTYLMCFFTDLTYHPSASISLQYSEYFIKYHLLLFENAKVTYLFLLCKFIFIFFEKTFFYNSTDNNSLPKLCSVISIFLFDFQKYMFYPYDFHRFYILIHI